MKIEHIAIWTNNLEKMKHFYETYFDCTSGEKYENTSKNFTSYFLTFDSGARLELMSMKSIPKSKDNPYDQFTGLIHLALSVGSKEAVLILTSRLKSDGYEVLDLPRTTGDGYFESIVLDPEGNRLELTI